jgi:predicted PhzF superfamily epimerase YddE/YHI9
VGAQIHHCRRLHGDPLWGNQLAVFPDGAGISDADMQAFAHEISFTETTFVLRP